MNNVNGDYLHKKKLSLFGVCCPLLGSTCCNYHVHSEVTVMVCWYYTYVNKVVVMSSSSSSRITFITKGDGQNVTIFDRFRVNIGNSQRNQKNPVTISNILCPVLSLLSDAESC